MFRFDYSKELLLWAMKTPGHDADLILNIKIKNSKKMVGFIAGIIVEAETEGVSKKMIEINFLCVDKVFRSKNFAPL